MAEHQPVGRRTALRMIGTAATIATGASAASATETQTMDSSSGTTGSGDDTDLTGVYTGTIDRVVDGDHVVILVEKDGRVIEQYVVPSDRYPDLDERDSVILLVIFGTVLGVWEF